MADRGFTVWFTGLSGAGKTTLAELLGERLKLRGLTVQNLDGDVVRQDLTADLGFSREDRDKNIARVTFVADMLTRNGVACLTSFISPYREARDKARHKIGAFVEVFTECPLEVCIERDAKGLYAKALAGKIPAFTGVSDPYEAPLNPEITVRTDLQSPEQCVLAIIESLENLGYLSPGGLIAPHGGRLVNRMLSSRDRGRLEGLVARDIELDYQTAKEVENLAAGLYSPLEGFLGQADYESVLSRGRLIGGAPWTIPLLLHLPSTSGGKPESGEVLGLKYGGNRIGVVHVTEVYPINCDEYAARILGTTSTSHPGVARLAGESEWVLAGPVSLFEVLPTPFPAHRRTPAETRRLFAERGWKTVVAFQTRNAPHLGHEYLQKTALSLTDGLYVNPVIGRKKAGDFEDSAIIASCEALVENYFPAGRTVLGILEYEMKYAGPREAVHHAIMRKNLGCSHLIVGRDHAGVGTFYGPYEAQEIFDQYPDLGIRPVKFGAFYYCTKCGTVTNDRVCPHGAEDRVNFSGTAVRTELLAMEHSEVAATAAGGPAGPAPVRPEVLDAIRSQARPFVEE